MKINIFKDNFVDNIYTEQKLANHTWFGVGGNAEILYIPEEEVALENFLKDKPKFSEIADDFLRFVRDTQLVIHNAVFDMKFINAELTWANKTTIPQQSAVDTLQIARKKFPGSPASLDALCRRFNIDNSTRTQHGALLDSKILAEVYLELSGGRQPNFELSTQTSTTQSDTVYLGSRNHKIRQRPSELPPRITEEEKLAHEAFIEDLGDGALWNKLS